jgi:hypothetical protein
VFDFVISILRDAALEKFPLPPLASCHSLAVIANNRLEDDARQAEARKALLKILNEAPSSEIRDAAKAALRKAETEPKTITDSLVLPSLAG